MQRTILPLRHQVLILALTLGIAFPSSGVFATALFPAENQAKVPTPTAHELEAYRKKLRAQSIRSQQDSDRIAFLMLLIDYAKVSLSSTASRGERQYHMTQLRDFVARKKAEKQVQGREASAEAATEASGDVRRHGPNADPVCYHEGVESECATDEEIAETQALADSAEYQNEQNQQTYDEVLMMISGLDLSEVGPKSGPSAAAACIDVDCFSQAATATASMGASVAAVLGWNGAKADAIAAGTKLSKATRWSWHLTIITTSLTAGYYLGSLIECSRNGGLAPHPSPTIHEPNFMLQRP